MEIEALQQSLDWKLNKNHKLPPCLLLLTVYLCISAGCQTQRCEQGVILWNRCLFDKVGARETGFILRCRKTPSSCTPTRAAQCGSALGCRLSCNKGCSLLGTQESFALSTRLILSTTALCFVSASTYSY